jgi:MFS family permease
MGLLGNAGLNAPLFVYVSRWFDRRRGSALALISSGGYLAGFVWPTIFERAIAYFGWRWTMIGFAILQLAVIVPLAIIYLRPPPEMQQRRSRPPQATRGRRCSAGLPMWCSA